MSTTNKPTSSTTAMFSITSTWLLLITLVLACLSGGCAKRWVSVTPPALSAGTYQPDAFKKDLTDYGAASDSVARLRIRNQMIYHLIAEIDSAYGKVEQNLSSQRSAMLVTNDFVQLGLGAATTLGHGDRTKTVLAALLSGVTGFDLSVDKNLFQQQTTQAIISAMRASRNIVKARIIDRLAQTDAIYPWAAARSDLIELLAAGSFRQGIQHLHQTAASEAQATEVDVNIALVAAVTPGDRESAGQFNKAISEAFRAKDFSKVVPFLKGMGSAVEEDTTLDKLEAEIRGLRKRAETDRGFRDKMFVEARKAALIL